MAGDNSHTTADQVSQQRRHRIGLTIQPVVLDRDILTFDITGPLASHCGTPPRDQRQQRDAKMEKSNDGQRRLLRVRRERPCRRAAESSDEIAPSKANAHLTLSCGPVDQAGDRGSTGNRAPAGRPTSARRRPTPGLRSP